MTRLVAIAAFCAVAGSALAQAAPVVIADEAQAACVPERASAPPIVYPKGDLGEEIAGTVRVKLRFHRASAAPEVTLLYSNHARLGEVVWAHVGRYRLPCLLEGAAPAEFVQEFHFRPDDESVRWFGSNSLPISDHACKPVGMDAARIAYPADANRQNETGKVLVRATFDGPAVEPTVKVLNDVGSRSLERAAVQALSKVRLVCTDPPPRWPVKAVQVFAFQLPNVERLVMKDLPLKELLRLVDGLGGHKVRFDLNSMSCPFDLKLVLYQPYLRNSVGEVGARDPNRAGLLQWLSGLQLRIPPETLKHVLGDTIRVSVPCGVLDLTS